MVLNDIIEQAAGRQSQTPEQGGNVLSIRIPLPKELSERNYFFFFRTIFFSIHPPIANVYILFIVR